MTSNTFQTTPKNALRHDRIVILDAGSHYTRAIEWKVRELLVESDVLSLDTPASTILNNGYRGIIISSGPKSVYAQETLTYDPDLLKLKIPVLGIGYGMQLINKEFGGSVLQTDVSEDGEQNIEIETLCPLFSRLGRNQSVLNTHKDNVGRVGGKLKVGGWSMNRIVTAIYNDGLRIYGVQFHPEVDLTNNGKQMLSNFLFDICKLTPNLTMDSRREECIRYIRNKVGNKKALCLVSGGIDSSVCAALLGCALHPSQIIAVHVDNGFMRKNESDKVARSLRDIGVELIVRNAGSRFLKGTTLVKRDGVNSMVETSMLCETYNPEDKRKIIGDMFIKVTNEVIAELKLSPDEVFLVQGTLLAFEQKSSMSKDSEVIKTGHNNSDLSCKLRNTGRVVEPLCNFYKDQVRDLGKELGLPAELVERQPFPGPGLAVRILCAKEAYMENDYSETQDIVRGIVNFKNNLEKSHVLINCITSATNEDEQAKLLQICTYSDIKATLLPVRSVGMLADKRSYSYAVGLSTTSQEPNWPDMFFLAKIIPRVLQNVNRVCYIFGEPVQHLITDITHTRLDTVALEQLRQADAIANEIIMQAGLNRKISQMPVILIPVHFDRDPLSRTPSCKRSVVLRPFLSNDFQTGEPPVPGSIQLPLQVLNQMVHDISKLDGISRILFDLTTKPPGTTEWE